MKLYPVLLNIEGRLAVVVGGGEVALRKVLDLLDAGALVKVVAPRMHEGMDEARGANPERVRLERREYRDGDLEGASLAFAATDSPAVNRSVFDEASRRGVFINAADDPPNCSFYLPSFVRKGDFLMAVSTSGASPALAARLRRELEKAVPENVGDMLAALREARRLLQEDESFEAMDFNSRGELLKKIVGDDALLARCAGAYRAGRLREELVGLIG
ncbi:MAG: bifunctional precorrin-2 dehydrogenase/sirohydrochlorin ferrochelatase [Spirochaetes bacterium]|jgi:precorrin-2 dehydrogenase/sirohydrochlorin ferrochelatase|nr:bifunctional precorrin-2 dehydrogenase/sirohydrochlorin ferrochelatase [Spirochaetota bacterium]